MRPLALFLACASALAACVSVEEVTMPKGVVRPGQRTLLLVYAAPGPSVTEEDTNVDTAAKLLPGLGMLVQSNQDEKDLAASKTLQQYLPAWKPDEKFAALLKKELAGIGYAGQFMTAAEAEFPPGALKELNRSTDELDWRLRYILPNPDLPVPRDYSKFLSLDDALVLEINLVYGVARILDDVEGKVKPNMSVLLKFYRAGTMRLLWKHEESLEDAGGAANLYDFETKPQDLMDKWDRLMAQLAGKTASAFKIGLTGAPVNPLPGQTSSPAVASSTATAVGVSTRSYSAPSISSGTVALSTQAYSPAQASTPTATISASSQTAPAVSPSTSTAP